MQHKNTLIAAAITAALAASASVHAEATVYGKIHTSVASVSSDTGTSDTSATAISSHASRVGVKGSKELSNGMTISAKAEFEMDAVSGSYSETDAQTIGPATFTDTDSYIFKARNIYVGLKGGFGEVRVGRHDTPHKMSTSKLDPFGDTYADYNNIIQVDNRLGNVLAYLNNFGPVGIAAAYYAGDDSVNGENNGNATSVMVNYSEGPVYLSGSVESYADTVAGDLQSATKFGVGYKIAGVDLGLVHEILAYDGSTVKDQAETYVSVQYKVSDTVKLKAAYGMRDEDVSGQDDEVMMAAGVDYKLDKSATVYALYADGSDGGLAKKGKLAGDGTALALGIVYKF